MLKSHPKTLPSSMNNQSPKAPGVSPAEQTGRVADGPGQPSHTPVPPDLQKTTPDAGNNLILSAYWLLSQGQFPHQTSDSLTHGAPQLNSMTTFPVLAPRPAGTRQCPCHLVPGTDGLSILLFLCCPAATRTPSFPTPPEPWAGLQDFGPTGVTS